MRITFHHISEGVKREGPKFTNILMQMLYLSCPQLRFVNTMEQMFVKSSEVRILEGQVEVGRP